MGVVYFIYSELCHWMAEVEFLVKFDVFVHIHCFLYHNILLHDVLLVGNSISKMFKLVLGFLINAIHLVLHFIGSRLVLNLRLCLDAKFSQISSIFWRANSLGASKKLSSEYPKILINPIKAKLASHSFKFP